MTDSPSLAVSHFSEDVHRVRNVTDSSIKYLHKRGVKIMKLTKLFVFCAVVLVGLAAWSQDFPRAEVAADYSYSRFYPVAGGTQSLSLNGGGGALVVNVTNYFGIKMDLQG
jgi:hypothetical protein